MEEVLPEWQCGPCGLKYGHLVVLDFGAQTRPKRDQIGPTNTHYGRKTNDNLVVVGQVVVKAAQACTQTDEELLKRP